MADVPAPPKKGEVRLEPGLQARILEQMREEQSAAIRSRQLKIYVLVPGVIAATLYTTLMAFDADSTTAMIGNTIASSLLMLLWKLRKRISASLGFG